MNHFLDTFNNYFFLNILIACSSYEPPSLSPSSPFKMEPFDLGAAAKYLTASEGKREEWSKHWSLAVAVLARGMSVQPLTRSLSWKAKLLVLFSSTICREDFLPGSRHRAASWCDSPILCQEGSGRCCPDVAEGTHLAPGGHSSGAVGLTAAEEPLRGTHACLVLPSALS